MTKTIYKRYLRIILSTLSMVSLMTPMLVMASENGTVSEDEVKTEDSVKDQLELQQGNRRGKNIELRADREQRLVAAQEKRQNNFCDRFADQAAKITENLTERGSQFESRITERSDDRLNKRNEREGKLEENRSEADARRNEMYLKLEAKADTDAKKEALVAFKKAVEAAVTLRREKVDAAILDFRKGVDAVLASRQSGRVEALATFKNNVDAAIAEAKAGCESGKSPETIRSTFKASLKDARTTLQTERQENNKIKDQILALVNTRQTTVRAALDEFKASLETAKADLKKAFGEIEKPKTETDTPEAPETETPEAPQTPAQ